MTALDRQTAIDNRADLLATLRRMAVTPKVNAPERPARDCSRSEWRAYRLAEHAYRRTVR